MPTDCQRYGRVLRNFKPPLQKFLPAGTPADDRMAWGFSLWRALVPDVAGAWPQVRVVRRYYVTGGERWGVALAQRMRARWWGIITDG